MTVEHASATPTAEDIGAALSAKGKRAAAKPKAEATPKAEKAPKAPKAPKIVVDYTLGPSDVIHFGERDGKKFGPDNVPYREDSKRAQRFALIKDGMTVEEAGKVGLTERRIRQMIEAGHIVVQGSERNTEGGESEIQPADPVEGTEVEDDENEDEDLPDDDEEADKAA